MDPEQVRSKDIEADYIESTLLGIQELKNNLVTQIAHSFRTPLSSVLGFAQMLLDDQPLTDQQRVEYARFIQYEGIRLSKLIDDLIELSSLQRESASLTIDRHPVQTVLSEAVERVSGFARGRFVGIRTEFPRELLFARLDRERIVQAVYQLLHNAVRMSYSYADVLLSVQVIDGGLEIAVRDCGPGIQEKEIPDLFDRFGRDYRPEQDPYATGVGLAIVKHITDLHKGTVRVESKSGEGSTFTLRIQEAVDTPPPGC